jgi:hypothetical protein
MSASVPDGMSALHNAHSTRENTMASFCYNTFGYARSRSRDTVGPRLAFGGKARHFGDVDLWTAIG